MTERRSTREKLERLRESSRLPAAKKEEPRTEQASPPLPRLESLHRLEREVLGMDSAAREGLSLKERLERLVEATRHTKAGRAPHRTPIGPHSPGPRLDEVLEGMTVANERGTFYQVDSRFPLHHRHGKITLSRLQRVSPRAFSVLARGDDDLELDLTRTVFLDTETTGLTGGSGTCAFLVGVGYLDEDHFTVRQLFMRDFQEEGAMLQELAELVSRFDSLVTFNGKSFDVPLLESRYVLTRLRFPLVDVPHFDLLHPARSLWKARMESCRLVELESLLLGLEREDDVPGELIPSLFFDYLRSGDASRIHPVFSHNCHDILSLAALTVRAFEMLDEDAEPEDPLDDYSLGRVFERARFTERSMLHYSRAVQAGLPVTARRRSLRQLALHHKRRLQWEEAESLWMELAEEEGWEAIQALQELAMVSEHRNGDFVRALDYCRRALLKLENEAPIPQHLRDRWREFFLHRFRRLERRRRGHSG